MSLDLGAALRDGRERGDVKMLMREVFPTSPTYRHESNRPDGFLKDPF